MKNKKSSIRIILLSLMFVSGISLIINGITQNLIRHVNLQLGVICLIGYGLLLEK